MGNSDQKVGKLFLGFLGICVLLIPVVALVAFSDEPQIPESVYNEELNNFDQNAKSIFDNYSKMTGDYIKGTSSDRTIAEFYSRREYAGSPPFIPHKVEDIKGVETGCRACHNMGGWTEELKRNTPLTPHPERIYCIQCHVLKVTEEKFKDHDWVSADPPVLGRSYLPGAPLPIPHSLQVRGNCTACHIGPGAVTSIRVEHPSRGYCRQCHVPDIETSLFRRKK